MSRYTFLVIRNGSGSNPGSGSTHGASLRIGRNNVHVGDKVVMTLSSNSFGRGLARARSLAAGLDVALSVQEA